MQAGGRSHGPFNTEVVAFGDYGAEAPIDMAVDEMGIWVAISGSIQGIEVGSTAILPGTDIHALALDETHVYWTEGRAVRRAPRASPTDAAIETLADGQADPRPIVTGKDSVFWLNLGDGRVMRAARLSSSRPIPSANSPWRTPLRRTTRASIGQ